jgi:uncharacterized repeat protein (TIGR03803 family)
MSNSLESKMYCIKILARVRRTTTISLITVALFLAASSVAYAQTIYAMTQSGLFGTLNVSTGVFTQLSNPGFEAAGLAGFGTNLFVTNYPGNTLSEINPTTGALVNIGNGTATYYDFGSTTQGLYGVGTDQNLYSVNVSTGATTLVGPTGIGPGGFQSLSGGGAVLYTAVPSTTGNDSVLYSVNTTTGAATMIGDTGVVNISAIGFAFGQLYAGDETGNLYTLNLSTGAATLVVSTGQAYWGLALPPQAFNVVHNFTGGIDGANPWAGLVMDRSGNLYGDTQGGGNGSCTYFGQSGCGVVYRLIQKNGNWVTNPLYSFRGGSDGEFATRPVTIGPNGSIYGTTTGGGEGTCSYDSSSGCGVVFNVTPLPTIPRTPTEPWLEKVLYRFTGEGDGGSPLSNVVFDSAGNIYGSTQIGGASNLGAVYKLTPSGGGNYTESVIYNFAGGSDGAGPLDGLIFDTAGNLYSTTGFGGGASACQGGCGTVFELSPNGSGWTEKILYSFQGGNDGETPNAGVVLDAAGNLYGNTWQGGAGGGGTVYELSPSGSNWNFNLIWGFPGNGYSVARLLRDSSGNLYGTLQSGGANGAGQAYELSFSNNAWGLIDLHDFTGTADGGTVLSSVAIDASGNLYGTAWGGGANTCGGSGCGVVWEITPNQ